MVVICPAIHKIIIFFIQIDVSDLGKIERTELHKKIKSIFGQSVNSTTEQRDLQKIIKCSRYNKKGERFVLLFVARLFTKD
jgi:hypothetical protein